MDEFNWLSTTPPLPKRKYPTGRNWKH